jgi:hypothetical protein
MSGTNLGTSKPYFCLCLWISVPPIVDRVNIIFQIICRSCDGSVNILIILGAGKPIFDFNLRTNSLEKSPSSEANSS